MISPGKETLLLLEDLERRIDPETEEDFKNQWRDFLYGRFDGDIFTPKRKKLSAPGIPLPSININDAIEDYDLMLQMQLSSVSAFLNTETLSPCLRANYGTGILSSLFGAELFTMPRHMNTLPTTKPFDDPGIFAKLIENGIPDLHRGLGEKVFAFGEYAAELLAKYPKVQKYAVMYHPDLQGPLDICELLWGSELFYAMYDEPELVHGMLTLITDTYTVFMKKWQEMFPPEPDMNPHWGNIFHRGTILLRCDSAMNVSPNFYSEFSVPYDKRLLDTFGGGAMHFCGRGDHYVDQLCSLDGMYGVNMSQPEYNDMEVIYRATVDKGIPLLGFSRQRAESDKVRNGCFSHNLHS
jgi:hypothetical protein